jgi:protein involved in polysaccharide export with SLBB domain
MGKVFPAKNSEVEFHLNQKFVYVGGAVGHIGQFEYNPSWHAIDYIAAAGVNPTTGTWVQVRVWRGNQPKAITVKVAEDPILAGDFIEVPKNHYESFKDFVLFLASLLTVVSSAFIIYASYNNDK